MEAPAGGGYAAQLAAARAAKASGGAAPAAAAPAAAAPPTVAPAAAAYAGPPVPLPESAVDRVRAAMALLVKHRGGGPFGAGRLSHEDVPNLEAALVDVLAVIKQCDFEGADPVTGEPMGKAAFAVATKSAEEKMAIEAHKSATGSSRAASDYMSGLGGKSDGRSYGISDRTPERTLKDAAP